MYISSVLKCLLPLLPLVLAQDTSLAEVRLAFAAANIPAAISLPFDPTVLLEVSLPQTAGPAITLRAGVQLPRNATAGPPTFRIAGNAGRGPFVVATVDPDAPTPQAPTSAQIRHFLGGNFVALDDGTDVHLLRNATPAITEFKQPTPPAGSDPHRYIFLLFNQPAGFNAQSFVGSTTSTSLFNISQFSAETGLGAPIAGTFMRVGPDPATA